MAEMPEKAHGKYHLPAGAETEKHLAGRKNQMHVDTLQTEIDGLRFEVFHQIALIGQQVFLVHFSIVTEKVAVSYTHLDVYKRQGQCSF